jgi:D-3-phosphoglycerate dehydrogenase
VSHEIVLSDDKTLDEPTKDEVLADVDASLSVLDEKTVDGVIAAVEGADGLIVDTATPVPAAVFAERDLTVVGRAGIGVDNVDVEAAADHGVTVVYVPDYCVDEVSTHALALLLGLAKSLPIYDRDTREGGWNWEAGRPIHRLRGRTLGLVGFGKIPRRLARKVDGFGLDVIGADPNVPDTEMDHFGVEKVGFDELLDRAHLVSVHAPLYEATRGLFDAAAFDAMREDALLVNTARGAVVDEAALYDAVAGGEIAGAGLDVLTEEPPGDSPLFELDRVLVTPHTGWYSEESRHELSRRVAEDVARVLTGEPPRSPVDPDLEWV